MGKYAKQVWISAPPEDVVEAIDTPDTWRIIVPSMQDAEEIELDDGGFRLAFTYKLAGIRTDRAIETSGSGPAADGSGTQHVFDLSGSVTGSYTFDVSEQGVGTRVKFDTQYNFSNRVLDRVTRRFLNQYVTRQFDSLLMNLKDYLEMEKDGIEPESITD